MAKIIRHNGQFAHYAPGVIYDIGIVDPFTKTRIPFYVGETSDPTERLKAHTRAGKSADDESTLVYQTIRALDDACIAWTMEPLAEFGEEGPTDLEDEWIMKHLYSGYKLKNMKKGNANWMAEREACASDMRSRSISSYRKYKEVLSVEEKQAEAERKQAEWIRQETNKTNAWLAVATQQARVAELERHRAIREAEIKKLTAEAYAEQEKQKQERLERARLQRERLDAEQAERRAQQVQKEQENQKHQTILREQREAQWEADRPAREARLKAEVEAKQLAEIKRQAQWVAEEQLQKTNREEWIKTLLIKPDLTQYEMVQVSKHICEQIKNKEQV